MFKEAIKVLNLGGIILYPTDTIWGIGCDATNYNAANSIYTLKQREETKSMLVLVDSIEMLSKYVQHIPKIAFELINNVKKPLTIIYPQARNLAPNIVASDNTIGIRITKDKTCKELIKEFGKPIVSTSANISGETTPQLFENISNEIKTKVDYILKTDKENILAASTIVKIINKNEYIIIRGNL